LKVALANCSECTLIHDFILLVKLLFLFEKKKGEEIGKFEFLLLWGNASEP
jgi:hypothetical protein